MNKAQLKDIIKEIIREGNTNVQSMKNLDQASYICKLEGERLNSQELKDIAFQIRTINDTENRKWT